jgi:hypothetical protein
MIEQPAGRPNSFRLDAFTTCVVIRGERGRDLGVAVQVVVETRCQNR